MTVAPSLPRLLLPLCLTLASWGAEAQGIAFGPFRQDPDEPVEVTSERLDVDQTGGVAVFSGDVVVVQGQMRLSAPRVQVDYSSGEAGRIERMHATGGVIMLSGEEAAEGDEAIYSVDAGTVLMNGDVIVTQGPNVVAGDSLYIDLDTGTGTMEGSVRTILQGAQ